MLDDDRRQRIRNALWGLFIADALAMPAHWYYDLQTLRRDFAGGLRGYVAPPHPHPDSFMVGMPYRPDVEKARSLGRPFDILHEHARFYRTSYGDCTVESGAASSVHGNQVPRQEERYHYHHGLQAGENTLGAHLVRVLLRSVVRCGRYEPQGFLDDFVAYLSEPGRNRDPYTEIYLRKWFENYSRGLPAECCAEQQRRTWSIGAHGGAIRPLVVAMLAESPYQGLGLALEHQVLTHRSENVASVLGVLVPLLQALLDGADPQRVMREAAAGLRLPAVTGEELKNAYRAHHGPGNIPAAEMWALHTRLEPVPFSAEGLLPLSAGEVVDGRLSVACYPEHGLPLLLYLALREETDLRRTLLANANAGGDNVHRGMILGLLVGAACRKIPAPLMEGLTARAELATEIDAFAELALQQTVL